MAWITVEDVEAYLGATLDSGDTAVYSDVIDAVCAWIECFCDTTFTDAVYSERIDIADAVFTLKNNLQHFYNLRAGAGAIIDVTPPNSLCSVSISEDGTTLTLINGFAETAIDTTSIDLDDIVTAIGAESGWSAALSSGAVNSYGRSLYVGDYRADINDSNLITLQGSVSDFDSSRISPRVFQAPIECAVGTAIYQGGYETIPDDLKDATIRMTIQAYNDRNPGSITVGPTLSEKVGDWQEGKYSAITMPESLASIAINYQSVLLCYRRQSI